jgi:hypothetical protein
VFYRRPNGPWILAWKTYTTHYEIEDLDYSIEYEFSVSPTDNPEDGEAEVITMSGKLIELTDLDSTVKTQNSTSGYLASLNLPAGEYTSGISVDLTTSGGPVLVVITCTLESHAGSQIDIDLVRTPTSLIRTFPTETEINYQWTFPTSPVGTATYTINFSNEGGSGSVDASDISLSVLEMRE